MCLVQSLKILFRLYCVFLIYRHSEQGGSGTQPYMTELGVV